ncbi:MAG: hypothetical protein HZB38_10215 [Planctomycetes bacterium]|nr:hypothetical protein [Planctomycetota bacterium]
MAANAIIQTIALGSPQWTPLGGKSTVAQVTLIADPENAGNINLRFRQGVLAEWPPGAAVPFESVDLAELEVQGNAGHALLIAGFAPGRKPRGRTAGDGSDILYLMQGIPSGGGQIEGGGEIGEG